MAKPVNLFRIYQNKNHSYDSYDSAVVAAYTIEEAREIHPSEYVTESVSKITTAARADKDGYHSNLSSWAEIEHIKADFLGLADIHIKAGDIICSSFNAG